jgi:hypothetical protein
MNKRSYQHFWIGAVSLLLINLLLTMPAEANGFSCRGSALRIDNSLFVEPTVANPPEIPCATDDQALLGVAVDGVSVEALDADTEDTVAPIFAEGQAAEIQLSNVLNLVNASVNTLFAVAEVKSVSGHCKLSSNSSVASAVIQIDSQSPIQISLLTDPQDIPILNLLGINVATLHLNKTLSPAPSEPTNPNSVTQRAFWLEVTDDTLKKTLKDVVVGEATADFAAGTSCPTSTADKRRMTGGGKFTDSTTSTTVQTALVLHCNVSRLPNHLQVKWGGNTFRLDKETSATCFQGAPPPEGPPPAGFNTFVGSGTGSLNGNPATASYTFVDHGEPGNKDTGQVSITDNTGKTVLNAQGTLTEGNYQAHK